VAGLEGLLRPLSRFAPGLLRLAPRLALVLDTASGIPGGRPMAAAGDKPVGSWLDRVAATTAAHYETALIRAREQLPLSMVVETPPAPAPVDYMVPALLLAACLIA